MDNRPSDDSEVDAPNGSETELSDGDATAATPTESTESAEPITFPHVPKWKVSLLLAPIIIAVIANYVSIGFFPKLVDNHPLALLALNSRNRNIVLVAGELWFWTLLIVALARRLILDPFFFGLGRLYGPAGVKWVKRRVTGANDLVEMIEKYFGKWGWLFVMFYAGEIVCTLAGATGMAFSTFILANLVGTVILICLAYFFSELFSGPVDTLVDFIGRYSLPLTILSLCLVAYLITSSVRSGKTGGFESVETFEKEITSDKDT